MERSKMLQKQESELEHLDGLDQPVQLQSSRSL